MNPAKKRKIEKLQPLSTYPGAENLSEEWTINFARLLHSSTFEGPVIRQEHVLSAHCAKKLIADASSVLEQEKIVVDFFVGQGAAVHVLGDLHGHFHDLFTLVERLGWPNDNCFYIFDGDFVDRGAWGVEVLLLLFAMKVQWPNRVYLLRGNHELYAQMVRYGFKKEAVAKYNEEIWEAFWRALAYCPLIAVVCTFVRFSTLDSVPEWALTVATQSMWSGTLRERERRVAVMHGGIFRCCGWQQNVKEPGSLEDVMRLCNKMFGRGKYMCARANTVLWSQPMLSGQWFEHNPKRGKYTFCIKYGPAAVQRFLEKNNLHGIIRAHDNPASRRSKQKGLPLLDDGWSVDMRIAGGKFHCSVFSASEYPMSAPESNRAGAASVYGGSTLEDGQDLMPKFTTLHEAPSRPKNAHLFYVPTTSRSCSLVE